MTNAEHTGWRMIRSAALEIDGMISLLAGGLPSKVFLNGEQEFVTAHSAWPERWGALIGPLKGWISIFKHLAIIADTIDEPDIGRMAATLQALDVATALAGLGQRASRYGLATDTTKPEREQLIDLAAQMCVARYRVIGIEHNFRGAILKELEREIRTAVDFLPGGDLYNDGWPLLEQFAAEVLLPWRASHSALLENQRAMLEQHLGALEGNTPPALDWISAQSVLLRLPEFKAAVDSGQIQVWFWEEPLGMFDAGVLVDDAIVVSFNPPAEAFASALSYVEQLARQVQALADPTRLMILRMIRTVGISNTDIAAYLEIARPTVSVHAKILREAGLIHTSAAGRAARHEIDPEAVRQLFRDLERFLDLPELND